MRADHRGEHTRSTASTLLGAVSVLVLGAGCNPPSVIGEGQFGRLIPIVSDSLAPLPRMVWRDGAACPGVEGGCASYCAGPPAACPTDSCMPVIVDSGSPLTLLPSEADAWSVTSECVELRAGASLLTTPDDPDALAASTAAFRFKDAPVVRAPRTDIAGWNWEVGDDRNPATVGGVIGGSILRDFAVEFRHVFGEAPAVAFFSNFPGSEEVLADQGRAYIRLQYPGRLLGRLLNDACELGPGVDCSLANLDINQANAKSAFESTRALVDACVAPPPCAVAWDGSCRLARDEDATASCSGDLGESATLLVATGVPGVVLFDDSADALLGPVADLPACADVPAEGDVRACSEGVTGRLVLPGWPPLEDLPRVKVRAVALLQGLSQPSGRSPCARLRRRLEGVEHQCRGFLAEGRPVRPSPGTGESVSDAAMVFGEVAWESGQALPDIDDWIDALIVPATASPVIALRREVVPEGAQPDGLIGGAMLRQTETVLDFTESTNSPGVRVRCLDPGDECLAIPACSGTDESVDFENADGGRTSCCFGLPSNLLAEVVLTGEGKEAPRVEDACCAALPRAAIKDLQSDQLGLCTGLDLP